MQRHTRALKHDAHSRVGLLEVQGEPCFLKLYLAKSRWHTLGFRCGYGRGLRSFDAARQLLQHSLCVPAPRAVVLVTGGLMLLTEFVVNSRDLRAQWLAGPAPALALQLMECAGTSLAALHRAGFVHGDCKWSNLLWAEGKFYLVDLEAVRAVRQGVGTPATPHPRQLRDLARFTVDAEELGVERTQYTAFLQSYCTGTHWPNESLARSISAAAQPIRNRHLKKYGHAHTPLL
jgi:tRNA A-37 threonylcarbamoyl transferase component Bud32